jgi:chitinase
LALSLDASPGSIPAASQWTVQYAPGDVTAANISAGPALTAAGKTLSCASSSGSLMCLASGLNTNTIANGVVALVNVTLAANTSGPSVALGLAGTLGALADGSAATVSGTGGAITVQGWTATQPPTAPTNLSTAADVTQIVLVWTASTDNVGVTGYLVERC